MIAKSEESAPAFRPYACHASSTLAVGQARTCGYDLIDASDQRTRSLAVPTPGRRTRAAAEAHEVKFSNIGVLGREASRTYDRGRPPPT